MFCAGILQLNKGYDDDILTSNLARLRNEVEKLLLQVASDLSAAKQQVIFLINNYECIRATLQVFFLCYFFLC